MGVTEAPQSKIAGEEDRAGAVADLFPGYFALVMATGIVSIAAFLHGRVGLADGLFYVNIAAYAVLWALTIARLIKFPRRMMDDLASHQRGAGFLTVVAGTAVLGSQAALLKTALGAAETLWVAAAVLWILLIYAFLTAITVRTDKPTLDQGINGGWLLLVVSTESLAVLGSAVAPHMAHPAALLFASLVAHLAGAMLYIVVIGLIFYRWTFFGMRGEQVTPPYWINMGALAITTVAGANLLAGDALGAGKVWPFLDSVAPFLKGTTVLFWAFASWWIPLLVIAGIWRHGIQRVKLAYDPQYWSMVFPLGMYSVATAKVGLIVGIASLEKLSTAFLWVAALAWAIVAGGMVAQPLSRRREATVRAS